MVIVVHGFVLTLTSQPALGISSMLVPGGASEEKGTVPGMEERYIPRRLYYIASVITEAGKRFQDSGQGGHARADNRGDISLTWGGGWKPDPVVPGARASQQRSMWAVGDERGGADGGNSKMI